jgi:hypothetical protein
VETVPGPGGGHCPRAWRWTLSQGLAVDTVSGAGGGNCLRAWRWTMSPGLAVDTVPGPGGGHCPRAWRWTLSQGLAVDTVPGPGGGHCLRVWRWTLSQFLSSVHRLKSMNAFPCVKLIVIYKSSSFHRNNNFKENGCLLGCIVVYFGRSVPSLQRYLLPRFSERRISNLVVTYFLA